MALHKRVTDVAAARVVSPIYARVGPSGSGAIQAAGGDMRVAQRIRRDFEAWRAEYGASWDARDARTPAPPHHATAGQGYAK